jgi:Protein of unknown function (DUF3626)
MTENILSPAQRSAIDCVRARAETIQGEAFDQISHVLRMSNMPASTLDQIRASIRSNGRIAVHLHPDRVVGDSTVSQALLADGIYKSQFETRISNGSVTAYKDGPRDEWERVLFGGNYHVGGVELSQRPKYGAFDLVRNSDGPTPRFGSCFFVLRPEVMLRTTFTYGGSQDSPAYLGTIDEFDAVVSALLAECFNRDSALGVSNVRPANLIARIIGLDRLPKVSDESTSRNLDHFIEAQIHGPIRLDRDVESLVADPSFRGTEIWDDLVNMSHKFGFPIQLHPGFRMRAADVPLDFRGPNMPSLAARVAIGGVIDARAIGIAAQELYKDSDAWKDRGSLAEVLQELKLLWHILVKYGGSGI